VTYETEDFHLLTQKALKSSNILQANYDKLSNAPQIGSNMSSYIAFKIKSMSKKGFGSEHTGDEIVQAMSEKRAKILGETLDEISLQTVNNILIETEKKEVESLYKLEDFLVLFLCRESRSVHHKSFDFLFKNGEPKEVLFIDDIEKKLDLLSLENINGMDTISELFFRSFYTEEELRSILVLPQPEEIVRFSL